MARRKNAVGLCPVQLPPVLAIIRNQAPIRKTSHEYLCAQFKFRYGLVVESVKKFLARLPMADVPLQLILSDIGLPGLTSIERIFLVKKLFA